jgi:putative heme-binding domain-containing protein
VLAEVAQDESYDAELRAEAIVGLAADVESQSDLLEKLAKNSDVTVQGEADRMLRFAGHRALPVETKPPADDLAAWTAALSETGDAAAGRRLFFSPIGPHCGACHQHDGRGGRVGPDLTQIGRSKNREQIIASILQPSREVAPHYQPWLLITRDGKTYKGLRQPQGGDNGVETYVDSTGKEFVLPSDTIEERSASEKSIMPDGLQETLTIADLRDLVAFLTESN